jgi:hydrogenase expression/formation protein HypC
VCLAVPGRILSLEGATARVDFGGVNRTVMTPLLEGLRVGDHVLVHAGFAIQKLEASEASEVLALIEQIPDRGTPDG